MVRDRRVGLRPDQFREQSATSKIRLEVTQKFLARAVIILLEPFGGAVQCPEDVADGLVVQIFVGHNTAARAKVYQAAGAGFGRWVTNGSMSAAASVSPLSNASRRSLALTSLI